MIATFPYLYPDELFYSACARYSERMGYKNQQTVLEVLIGRRAIISCTFPKFLNIFISSLPPDTELLAPEIIQNHTLFPYYAPFLTEERANQIYLIMLNGEGKSPNRFKQTKHAGIIKLNFLKYCPVCLKQDKIKVGESYWHRDHQMRGIDVCIEHKVFLEESPFPFTDKQSAFFYTASMLTCKKEARFLDPSTRIDRLLIKIAETFQWIKLHNEFRPGNKSIREKYFSTLVANNMANLNGKTKVEKLLKNIRDFYSFEVLDVLGCPLDNSYPGNNWPLRIMRSSNPHLDPIFHILMILFLSNDIENFQLLSSCPQPFGAGPWPCLNKASDHYLQPVVQDLKMSTIYSDSGDSNSHIRGLFSCQCGFVYSRIGPDRFEEDRYKIKNIIELGDVWLEKFKMLIQEERSLQELFSELDARDMRGIRKATEQLGLPFIGSPRTVRKVIINENDRNRSVSLADIQYEYRKAWENARSASPDLGTTELCKTYGILKEYVWLNRNDKLWLRNNLPTRRRHSGPCKNWGELDRIISESVFQAARKIKDLDNFPIKITKANIWREIGMKGLLSSALIKMPLTMQAISISVESHFEYSHRRIDWAYKYFIKENRVPKITEFFSIAKLSHDSEETIRKLVFERLSELMSKISDLLS